MQIELIREYSKSSSELPESYKPYRIYYWFELHREPIKGQVIYLSDPIIAKRIEGAIDAIV